jgi:segregation and condensation protein A
LRRLRGGAALHYDSLFENNTRSGMVATFLALLELIHGKRVSVKGSGNKVKIQLISDGGKRGYQKGDRSN